VDKVGKSVCRPYSIRTWSDWLFFIQQSSCMTMLLMVLDPGLSARAFSRTFLHATLLA
jgi:hypothetical protein